MTRVRARFGRGPLLPAAVLGALLASGCGDDSGVGTTYPVRGKILLNNEPFTASTTVIVFKPNAARGNKTALEPAGKIDDDGNYTLLTKGRSGAPPGWYKVVVAATGEPRKGATKHRPAPQSLLPAKYGQAKTTPLEVEVVENPSDGAYDLKLTR
jgi:hypothetical protein